jgi:hypothetical protein
LHGLSHGFPPACRRHPELSPSTNPARVQQVSHPDERILEIIGKPYDMQMIIAAVKNALA